MMLMIIAVMITASDVGTSLSEGCLVPASLGTVPEAALGGAKNCMDRVTPVSCRDHSYLKFTQVDRSEYHDLVCSSFEGLSCHAKNK